MDKMASSGIEVTSTLLEDPITNFSTMNTRGTTSNGFIIQSGHDIERQSFFKRFPRSHSIDLQYSTELYSIILA